MKFIKSYSEINESNNPHAESILCAHDVIKLIKGAELEDGVYLELDRLEYDSGTAFDVKTNVKIDTKQNFSKDPHFVNLSWEIKNFEEHGYSIDAKVNIDEHTLIPEITLHLLIDGNKENSIYKELEYRLIDIITHELQHTKQIGWNREPHNVYTSNYEKREEAKDPIDYFKLPDEVEAMVAGMYARSIEEDSNIDDIFRDYLNPFISSGKMTEQDVDEILEIWITAALEKFPGSRFSDDPFTGRIIDSI